MDIKEALDIVVARTGHERFRDLCNPDHPAYNQGYVDYVMREAQGMPPLSQQIVSGVKAIGRFVVGGFNRATPEERDARLAICRECDRYDAEQVRCRVCGCYLNEKTWLASESCPLPHPKWGPIVKKWEQGDCGCDSTKEGDVK